MKILLAEDDKNISAISMLVLEKLGGHNVTLVTDGEQALKKALTESFDLILLDEMMPKKNGISVSIELKGKLTTPIIFFSAKGQSDDINAFNENGIGYIPKPFDPNQLCATIDMILKKRDLNV